MFGADKGEPPGPGDRPLPFELLSARNAIGCVLPPGTPIAGIVKLPECFVETLYMYLTSAERAPLTTCIELCCPTAVISRPSTGGMFGSIGCEPLTITSSRADSPIARAS